MSDLVTVSPTGLDVCAYLGVGKAIVGTAFDKPEKSVGHLSSSGPKAANSPGVFD